MFGKPLHWRETQRQPRFLIFDGRLSVLLLVFVMHPRTWTFALVVIAIGVTTYFGRKGVAPDSILRFIRMRFIGRKRSARGLMAERSYVDFGFETEDHVERARQAIVNAEARHKAKNSKKSGKAGKGKR